MGAEAMECGKLTAKLRDAVPVCFMVNGKEVKRYKNIEIPDSLKKLPFAGFKLDVTANGGAIALGVTVHEKSRPSERLGGLYWIYPIYSRDGFSPA